jgi:hypothetical protein
MGALAVHAQALPPAIPVEISGVNAEPYQDDLNEWGGSWQAPQAIYDRGTYQDDKDAWAQDSDDEGSTWSNDSIDGTSYGILVVDLQQIRTINQFRVFQMMDSDGKTTGISIFRSTAIGDIAPLASGKGWVAVAENQAVADGVNNGADIGNPTNIDVASFTTRYIMIHVFNDGSLGEGDYIELKGIKAFDGASINYMRGGPVLTMAASPANGGTTEPAIGEPHPFTMDAPVAITATVAPWYVFDGWTATGDATLGDADSITTTVTIHSGGSLVTAHFSLDLDRVTTGSTFWVTAEDAGLGAAGLFNIKPKIYALYTNPVTAKTGKATAKVLTKVDKDLGTASILCEWTKKIKVYNAKHLKAAEKDGTSAADWIDANQFDLGMDMHAASKQLLGGDQPITALGLGAPVILTATVGGAADVSAVTMEGLWFGTKAPKVWREYSDANGAIKHQAMKVVKPSADNTTYVDSKGKPACMDPASGESKIIVIVPIKDPKGNRNGTIVIDNGVGLATGTDPTLR